MASRKRGRPVHKLCAKLFLLDPDNRDTKLRTKEVWSADAKVKLQQKGYGPPRPEHRTNPEKDTVEFSLELTNEEFKQKLVEIYPKLEDACFVFMKAYGSNQLDELNPGTCCYRCYTPENVFYSKRGQGKLYIRIIAESEILPCTHGISRIKRSPSTVGGCETCYVPIRPKLVPAVPGNLGVATASSNNVVTSVAMPTNCQLLVSGINGIDLRQLLCNTPVLDLSLSSIVVAPTTLTSPVQNSGNMVAQRPLSAVTFVDESWPPVSVFGNSTAHGSSPALAIDSGTETIPPVHSSGNIVTQSPVPTLITVSQSTESTLSVQNYSELIHEFMPPDSSSGNLTEQGPLSTSDIVHDTETSPADHSFGDITESPVLSEATNLEQPTSDTPSPFTVDKYHQAVEELSPILKDDSMNVDTNTNMMEAAETGSQPSNEVRDTHDHLSTPSPNFSCGSPASNRSVLSPGSDILSDINDEIPLNQHIDSLSNTAKSSNIQVSGTITRQVGEGEAHLKRSRLDTPSPISPLSSADGAEQIHWLENVIETVRPKSFSTSKATSAFPYMFEITNSSSVQRNVLSGTEELRTIDTFLKNVESTKKLEISLAVLDNDAILKKLQESTINIDTVEIQSSCKVHQVLSHYPLPSCLEVLHINENNLNFEDICDLGRLCSVNGLRELYLPGTKFKESSFFAFICILNKCKDLRSLVLTDNGLTKEDITCLITAFKLMKNLENLTLSKSNLIETQANDILQKHGQAENIVFLDLSQNAIQGNEIISGICQLQSLEELNLSHNYIRFSPLPNLKQKRDNFSANTKIISLAFNNMSPDDICQFRSLILSNLLKLNLDFNHVGNSIWSLCSLGLRIKHLKVLSLVSTDIYCAADGLANLLSLVGKLEELNLSSNNLMANDFRILQTPLSNLIQLKKLNLSNNPQGISALLQGILPSLKYLEELRLSNTHLNSHDLSKICDSLASLSSLKYLDLSMNAISSDGLRALANILKEFPLLEGLDISRSCIKEDDISVLCKGLVPLKKVKYLNLSGNRIDLEVLDDDLYLPPTLEELIFSDIITHGGKLFAKMKQLKNLRKLHLNKLRLRACDVEALAAMLSSFLLLEDLSLAHIAISDLKCETILSAISSLGNIKKIDLSGIKLFDEKALAYMLSSLSSLEELVLTDMKVAHMDCERFFSAIKLLTHLRKFNLGVVKIRDEKALFEMLSSLSVLEEIVFPDVELMNIGCMTGYFSSLGSLRYLKHLDLHCTKIRKPGVEDLARVLSSLQLLEKLVLEWFCLDDECQKQLFSALRKLKYLKELKLCKFDITQTGAQALADVLPSLQLLEKLEVVNIDFYDGGQEQLFAALRELKYMKEVDFFWHCDTQTDAEVLADVLPSLQLLEKLKLQCIDFDDGCQKQLFAALGNLKYLKELNLYQTDITQTGAEALAGVLPSLQLLEKLVLKTIYLDDEHQKQLFAALGKLKYLKVLNLCETDITQIGAEALADVLPSLQLLEKLVLRRIQFDDGSQVFAALGKLKYLKKLHLSGTHITQTGVEALVNVLQLLLLEKLELEEISFDDECQKQLFAAIKKMKYLKELNFHYTRITQTGAESLADVLPSLQLLEKLKLQCIDFDDGCQKQLFAALGNLKYLKELNLYQTDITQTGAEALAGVLPSLQLLEKLVLKTIYLDDEHQKQLFAALGKLKYLKVLNLCETDITQIGAEALADVLPSLQLLEKLVLRRIQFDDGSQVFAALGKLKYLKKLHLSGTHITQTGVEALVNVLQLLLLEKLELEEISFDDECQKQLFAAIKKMKYLKELSFHYTRITQTGAESLADVLSSLQLFEKLELGESKFDDGCQKQLFAALGKLKDLKQLTFDKTRITQRRTTIYCIKFIAFFGGT